MASCPICKHSGGNMRQCPDCGRIWCYNCINKKNNIASNICPFCGCSRVGNVETNSFKKSQPKNRNEKLKESSKEQESHTSTAKVTPSSNTIMSSSSSGDSGAALFGAAVGTSAALVGFGLKGIWKIIVFPFWLMFWMFKGMFYVFKGMFYTFPSFLWSKGIIGKICCGTYLFAWGVALFVARMGKDYVFRTWLYLIIILVSIIATAAITITFRLLDKQFTKRFAIALSSGVFAVAATIIIGIFLTKHLIPLEGEIKSFEDKKVIENTQSELLDE